MKRYWIWAAICTYFALTIFGGSNAWFGLVVLAIGWVPALRIHFRDKKVNAAWEKTVHEFAQFAENPESKLFYDSDPLHNSLMAINLDKQLLVLGHNGVFKKYPFEDVRKWEIAAPTPNFAGNAIANAGARAEASNATGFTIQVKDIDNPTWFFQMHDSNLRNRWFEIFNQAINEGGIVQT